MNTAAELIRAVQNAGGNIARSGSELVLTAPKPLPSELVELLRERKHEILSLLQGEQTDLDASLQRFERMNVALRIESGDFGTLWLIPSETCRALVDTNDPVYTAQEARILIDFEPEHARFLHRLRKTFGGTVEFVNQQEQLRTAGQSTTGRRVV